MRKNCSKTKGQSKKTMPFKLSLPAKAQSQTKKSIHKQLHQKIYGKQVTASRDRDRSRYSFRQQSANKSNELKVSKMKNSKQICNQKKQTRKRNDQTTMTQPNDHHLRFQFDSAVSKVFTIIDIFSRGVISEANINKWVPQAALYFLGSVFQKIRNTRKPIAKQQFHDECLKLFRKSLEIDIKQFIKNIKQFQNSNDDKISVDLENTINNKEKTIQSRVEDRFIFQENGDTSFRDLNFHAQNTMPVRVNRQQFIKEKEKIGNTERRDEDLCQDRQKDNFGQKRIRKNHLMEWNKVKNNLPEPLKDIGEYQNVALRNNRFKKTGGLGNHLDLPLKPSPKNSTLNPKTQKQNSIPSVITKMGQSPHFNGNINSQLSNKLNEKRTNIGEKRKEGNDKIDELSLRLENFIKQNAARLERSKNARIDL